MSSIAHFVARQRVLLGCLSVAISCVVVALCAERTTLAFDRKTFSIIHVGMPEQDVFDLLGKPGWHVGFGRTSLAMGRIRPYFDPSGVREHGEGQMTKPSAATTVSGRV